MLSCEQATRLMSEGLDRPLAVKERLSLNVHLVMCSGCRRFGDQVQGLRQLARDYARGKGDAGDDGSA